MTDYLTTPRAEDKRKREAHEPTALDEALSAAIEKHMPYEIDAFGVDRYDAHLVVEHLRDAGFAIVPEVEDLATAISAIEAANEHASGLIGLIGDPTFNREIENVTRDLGLAIDHLKAAGGRK